MLRKITLDDNKISTIKPFAFKVSKFTLNLPLIKLGSKYFIEIGKRLQKTGHCLQEIGISQQGTGNYRQKTVNVNKTLGGQGSQD